MKFIATHEDEQFPVEVERHGSRYRVKVKDAWIEVDLVSANSSLRSLRLADGRQYLFGHHTDGASHEISFGDRTVHVKLHDPLSLKRRRRDGESEDGGGSIKARMPGRVVRVMKKAGDEVRKGEGLLILEAMKMENEITAPISGVLVSLFVSDGQTVENGADLALVEAVIA